MFPWTVGTTEDEIYEEEAADPINEKLEKTLTAQIDALDKIFSAVEEAQKDLRTFLGDSFFVGGLNDYRDEAFKDAKSKGWHDSNFDDFPTKLALMHSEISEALEEFRSGRGYDEIYYDEEKPGKPEGIPIELADLFIRLMDLCGKYDIDIESAVKMKMEFNKTRPHRHGGKKV